MDGRRGLTTVGRGREALRVERGAKLLSVGRLFTEVYVARFESAHKRAIEDRLARFWAEVAHFQREGLWRDAALLIERLQHLEWTLAEREGDRLGVGHATGNLFLNECWDNDGWGLLIGAASQTAYNNTNAQLGVGDSTTAASVSQTDLQAATNKTYKAMSASFPAAGGAGTRRMDFKAQFASGDANYDWREFVLRNGATDLTDMSRVVSTQGTKASGQTWDLTETVTIS